MRANRNGRGTRHPGGMFSAVSLGLTISGITITQTGIQHNSGTITPTIMGYLDDVGGYAIEHTSAANYKISGGTVAWAGSSLGITTGLTSVLALCATVSINSGADVTRACMLEWVHSITGGKVTAALVSATSSCQKNLVSSGGTMHWIAFGT